jgi:hypothetical protein
MAIKHTEFMRLTQGNKSLNEYLQAIINLARYASEFIDTDTKKIASFKRGLSPKLMKSMVNSKCVTFNEFVSDALTQENNDKVYAASKTCKFFLRPVLLNLRHQWYPKLNIVHLMLMSGTTRPRRRIKLKLVFTRGTQCPCHNIPLDRAAPMFPHC